ncbi:MAG: S8 family serine peptidase [Candidatus Zixiibacteriota bacterium]
MKTKWACRATIVLVTLTTSARAQFYHGVDGPVAVRIDSTRVSVEPYDGFSTQDLEEAVASLERIIGVLEEEAPSGFVVLSISNGAGLDQFLDTLQAVPGVELVEPYYRSETGMPLMVGNRFIAAFSESVSGSAIDSICDAFSVEIDHEIDGMPKVFLLRNTRASGLRMLNLANAYHELDQTLYSHPDFRAYIETTSYMLYDYYHNYQPQTKKVIGQFNSASVWDFAGIATPVTVALLDDGVDEHEDLPVSRILPGYDVGGALDIDYDHDYDPRPGQTVSHGMSTAGIVGASHTTESAGGAIPSSGVISIDPHVKILPIKIFNDEGNSIGVYVSDLVAAFTYSWTHGADILSNSWTYSDPAKAPEPALNHAIERATLFGRGGRGCPVIFASGNTTLLYPNPNGVGYPAKLSYCFAIGAIGLDDYRRAYSRYGPELDMVAPSDDASNPVWALDQMGVWGKNSIYFWDCPPAANDVDYNCHFGGTSAACPLASGTAALLLSKDPTLSAQAVYYILRNSADTSLAWGNITPGNWEYGYGRLDAFRAVLSLARGDANNDGSVTVGDVTFLIDFLFISGQNPPWPDLLLGDANCNGDVSVGDVSLLIDHLFVTSEPLPLPCFAYND